MNPGEGRTRHARERVAGWRRGTPHRADHPALLDQVLASSLEPDYEVAARRRRERAEEDGTTDDEAGRGRGGRRGRGPGRGRVATVAVLVAFAVLVVAAGRENRQDSPGDALVRETLVATAGEKRQELADLQAQVAQARQDNADLAARGRQARQARVRSVAELRRTAAASGFQAVTGPGLQITVSDGPADLVQSNDLAILVDGLWAAGAEAIAISGQRLTARSAITSTGTSINVNRRPLTPPYVLSVVGDPRTLEAQLAETLPGQAWQLLVGELGFGYQVDQRDEVALPAAREVLLQDCGACYPNLDEPSGQQQPGEGASTTSPAE